MKNKKQERLENLQRQIARVEQRILKLTERSNYYRSLEIMIFVFGILLSIVVMSVVHWAGPICFVIAFAVLVFVITRQQRVDRSIVKHQMFREIYVKQVARVRLAWDQLPLAAFDEADRDHPFEIDFDITGEHSLHRLMNTGVSSEGSILLRDWLLNTQPDLEAIYERQNVVQELVPLVRFRDKLQLHSRLAIRVFAEQIDGEQLLDWLDKEEGASVSRVTLFVGVGLSALMFVCLVAYVFFGLAPLFVIGSLLLSFCWFLVKRGEIGYLVESAGALHRTLDQLGPIFEYLEGYPYRRNKHLKQLCEPFFLNADKRPSHLLKELARLSQRAELQKSAGVWMAMNAVIPLGMYLSYQLKKYKVQVADVLPAWLDSWYELEALCSLANFAYLNPDYVMPKLLAEKQWQGGVCVEGKGLGHPLLPAEQKVVNDCAFHELGDLMMITGSNMAGKSTFLRTIGINLCLAYAGGPVNALSLKVSLLELYACIKVSDSVTDGYSYFYAEVRRLKGLLNRLEQGTQYPVLFLIDEIFKGTNNRERLIGSNAYIHALLDKRCVGAISTHDLELVRLADTVSQIKNYHFKEDVVDGKMVFDYKLRMGPSPTTNALKIMELEGLPTQVYPL